MLIDIDRLEPVWEPQDFEVIESFQGVIISCSGGADSTALSLIFSEMTKRKNNFPLALFHMNFGLRGNDSVEDERFVRDLAAHLDCALYVEHADASTMPPGESVQEWARRLRREKLELFAGKTQVIVLGHHLDDVAESVLMRLSRGSSPGTMAGMRVYAQPYWRPLLTTSKEIIKKYLQKQGQTWREDLSNASDIYARNVVRLKVLPELERLFPGASARIARTALEAQDLAQAAEQVLVPKDFSCNTLLPLSFIASHPDSVARFLLASLIKYALPNQFKQLSQSFLDQVLLVTRAPKPGVWARQLPGGGTIKIHDQKFWIEP